MKIKQVFFCLIMSISPLCAKTDLFLFYIKQSNYRVIYDFLYWLEETNNHYSSEDKAFFLEKLKNGEYLQEANLVVDTAKKELGKNKKNSDQILVGLFLVACGIINFIKYDRDAKKFSRVPAKPGDTGRNIYYKDLPSHGSCKAYIKLCQDKDSDLNNLFLILSCLTTGAGFAYLLQGLGFNPYRSKNKNSLIAYRDALLVQALIVNFIEKMNIAER